MFGTYMALCHEVCVCVCVCVCITSELRRTPVLMGIFNKQKSASKYISLSVEFTTLLERSLVLRGKLCFRDSRRIKNNTSNLRLTLVFSSEKC